MRCERLPRISEQDGAVFWSRRKIHRGSHCSDIWAWFPSQSACLLWALQTPFLKIKCWKLWWGTLPRSEVWQVPSP